MNLFQLQWNDFVYHLVDNQSASASKGPIQGQISYHSTINKSNDTVEVKSILIKRENEEWTNMEKRISSIEWVQFNLSW